MSDGALQDSQILRLVEIALREDVGMGDLTSEATLDPRVHGSAKILCKEAGVIAGLDIASLVFRQAGEVIDLEPLVAEGDLVPAGTCIALVRGDVLTILTAERTALNFLQRMSGIATLTRTYVDAVAGTHARITDTRKTAPGLRALDKVAVRLGGGVNHRFGLDDMALIKDNHVVAAGGIRPAVDRVVRYVRERGLQIPVEIETRTLDEVREALSCKGLSRIMLDNFPLDAMREAVMLIGGRLEVEASGGITLETVRPVAETGVDFISVGALTHSVRALDLSLELTPHG
jgi:nicotinate-nucleotide pyrophosphorylase (carboxylating)